MNRANGSEAQRLRGQVPCGNSEDILKTTFGGKGRCAPTKAEEPGRLRHADVSSRFGVGGGNGPVLPT